MGRSARGRVRSQRHTAVQVDDRTVGRLLDTALEDILGFLLEHPAVAHDQHFVGDAIGLVVLVRREHDGHAPLAAGLRENRFDLFPVRRVHAGRGLVEQQDVGVRDQGAGESRALRFSARQAVGGPVGELPEAHLVQHAGHAFFDGRLRHASEPQAGRHVLEYGGPEQVHVLHQQRDAAAVLPAAARIGPVHGPAFEEDPAFLRQGQQGEYVQQRGLARSVRAVDGIGPSGIQGEVFDMQMKPGTVTVRQVLAHNDRTGRHRTGRDRIGRDRIGRDRIGHQSSNPCSQ